MRERAHRNLMVVEIDKEFQAELKTLAIRRNITLKTLVMRALVDYVAKEHKFDKKTL